MFSSRLPADLGPNALSQAIERARRSGRAILDLTETNPTAVGLHYPANLLKDLANPGGLSYRPAPLGSPEAREAVAATYRTRGAAIPSDRVVLTASTSEAYSLLFKLLMDPGDGVLVPQPSYPLFDLLTQLDAVRAQPYRLRRADDWSIDRDSVRRALTPFSRAALVVSPNNPTGSMLRASDRDWLVETAAAHRLALVSDEVFAEYPLAPRDDATTLVGEDRVLSFTLGGLSKSAGLPQLKLAWIVVSGPPALAADALERLAVIADSYLSVSTPVQVAAPRLLQIAPTLRAAIHARVRDNLERLRAAAATLPSLTVMRPEGGWSAVVRVPATEGEEELVLRLLNDANVLVHPGYFFDFSEEAFLVLSLLPSPDVFEEALPRIVRTLSRVRV
jgi:alanine-synthesizing transaminase